MPAVGNNPKLSALWVIDENQARYICIMALEDYKGDVSAAAKALNIGRTTLNRWLVTYPQLRHALIAIRSKYQNRRGSGT